MTKRQKIEFATSINKVDANISALNHNGVGLLSAQNIIDNGRQVTINGKIVLNFVTNSCLNIQNDPRVKQGVIDAVKHYGTSFTVSRIFATAPQHEEFIALLSRIFDGYPIIFASTTLGHLSALPVLLQNNDFVLLDSYLHNSVKMAIKTVMQTTKLKIKTIRHNSMEDLKKTLDLHHGNISINNIWYLTDGINSVSGSHCPIKELYELMNQYPKLYAYVDDAHGMSVFGRHGCGYALKEFEFFPEKLIVAVSLSKSFGIGAGGAIVFPNQEWRNKVYHCGPTSIYSTPLSPPLIGAGIASAKIHLSDEIIQLQRNLYERVHYFTRLLADNGLSLMNSDYSSMQFLKIGSQEKTVSIAHALMEHGFLVNPFIHPAVREKSSGIRIVVSLHNTKKDIKKLVLSLSNLIYR